MMKTGSIGTPAPLGSGLSLARVRLTVLVGIATAGLAACNAGRSTEPTSGNSFAKVRRILVVSNVAISLEPVFAHSFEHSIISALQSNGVEAVVVTVTSPVSDAVANHAREAEKFAPDAKMRITVRPIYRTRIDGYPAIVGTEFEVSLIDPTSEKRTWHATGKVNYIKMFGLHYRASPGIRKEFAWHTTAAVVRKFVTEVNGQDPAPIHTVTEARQRHGQRVD